MRDDLFEQSFYISLFLGDALSTYFNEKAFYNIPVCFSEFNQYFKVVNSNGKDYVYAFSPAGVTVADRDIYIVACVDFTDVREYSYTFLQFDENLDIALYVYGDSQKRFYAVSYDPERSANDVQTDGVSENNNYIRYAANDGEGWTLNDADEARRCFEFVKDEFEVYSVQELADIQNSKCTVTEDQHRSLNEKYFGNDGGQIENIGMQTLTLGGVAIGTHYIAKGERQVAIPKDIQYLSSEFSIIDTTGNVASLYIPASLKGVKEIDGDNAVTDVAADNFILDCVLDDGNESRRKFLENITVAIGSDLFESGSGHLRSKTDGHILYYADIAIESLDHADLLDLTSVYENYNFENYYNLFSKLTRIELKLNDHYDPEINGYGASVDMLNAILAKADKIVELNITSDRVSGEGIHGGCMDVKVPLYNDINVGLALNGGVFGVALQFENKSSAKRNVVLTADSLPVNSEGIIQIYGDGNISAVIKLAFPKRYYDEMYGGIIYTEFINGGECDFEFDETKDPSQGLPSGMEFVRALGGHGDHAVRLTAKAQNEMTVPDEYNGMTVSEVQLNADEFSTGAATVRLPSDVKCILFYTDSETDNVIGGLYLGSVINEDLTFVYDGNYESFCESDIRYLTAVGYAFKVQCSDGVNIYENLPEAPRDFFDVTIDINGIRTTQSIQLGWSLNYDPSQWNMSPDYIYYLIGDDGSSYIIYEGYGYADIYPQAPTVYTLVRLPKGTFNEENGMYFSEYTIEYEGIELTVSVSVMQYSSHIEVRYYLGGGDEYVYISSDMCDLFGTFDINVSISDADGNSRVEIRTVRFVTERDGNGTLTIVGLEQCEIKPDDGKDKK